MAPGFCLFRCVYTSCTSGAHSRRHRRLTHCPVNIQWFVVVCCVCNWVHYRPKAATNASVTRYFGHAHHPLRRSLRAGLLFILWYMVECRGTGMCVPLTPFFLRHNVNLILGTGGGAGGRAWRRPQIFVLKSQTRRFFNTTVW